MNYLKRTATGSFTVGFDTEGKPVYVFDWTNSDYDRSVLVIDGEDAGTIARILDVSKLPAA